MTLLEIVLIVLLGAQSIAWITTDINDWKA